MYNKWIIYYYDQNYCYLIMYNVFNLIFKLNSSALGDLCRSTYIYILLLLNYI